MNGTQMLSNINLDSPSNSIRRAMGKSPPLQAPQVPIVGDIVQITDVEPRRQ